MAYEDYIRLIPRGYKSWTKFLKEFDKMRDGKGMIKREVSTDLFTTLTGELYRIVAPYIEIGKEVVKKPRVAGNKRKAKHRGKDSKEKVKVTYR